MVFNLISYYLLPKMWINKCLVFIENNVQSLLLNVGCNLSLASLWQLVEELHYFQISLFIYTKTIACLIDLFVLCVGVTSDVKVQCASKNAQDQCLNVFFLRLTNSHIFETLTRPVFGNLHHGIVFDMNTTLAYKIFRNIVLKTYIQIQHQT